MQQINQLFNLDSFDVNEHYSVFIHIYQNLLVTVFGRSQVCEYSVFFSL